MKPQIIKKLLIETKLAERAQTLYETATAKAMLWLQYRKQTVNRDSRNRQYGED